MSRYHVTDSAVDNGSAGTEAMADPWCVKIMDTEYGVTKVRGKTARRCVKTLGPFDRLTEEGESAFVTARLQGQMEAEERNGLNNVT